MRSRSPTSKETIERSSAFGRQQSPARSKKRVSAACGDVRTSSLLNSPRRARSTMRGSMSVPTIVVRAVGAAVRQTAASV
jgi:hypothetical protein